MNVLNLYLTGGETGVYFESTATATLFGYPVGGQVGYTLDAV
ncbi:MAG: hypothetical protein OEW39_06760 [Deltaproteobacteria bacterium]|nr:hypothetical protein [Deltaproteobacteria bacterium]